ncbi:MAG: hypothetical protein KDD54_09395 [Flavobacteriales bacterium]|nr:hypothetical protein [Flavobacteriales bacterium]
MKRTLTLAISLFTMATYAQKIKVSEGSAKYADGNHNSFLVTIYEASQDDVEKEWKSIMKGYKAKVAAKDEIFADNALIKSISENTLDVYAKATKQKDNSILFTVAVDMGGAYMSSSAHPTEYKIMEKIVNDFAVKTTKDAIADIVKKEEKTYSVLEKEQEELVSKNERSHKDIENYKSEIEKLKKSIEQAEKDIEQNVKDQEKKKEEVAKQKKVVEDVTARQKAVN